MSQLMSAPKTLGELCVSFGCGRLEAGGIRKAVAELTVRRPAASAARCMVRLCLCVAQVVVAVNDLGRRAGWVLYK